MRSVNEYVFKLTPNILVMVKCVSMVRRIAQLISHDTIITKTKNSK